MSLHNFYRSKKWESLLAGIKEERINSSGMILCDYCDKPMINAYDMIGHHTIPLTEENYTDYDISLNPTRIRLVHHRCHNIIHDRLMMNTQRQVFLVYGSPLSGKSTWVRENMAAGDLVIDMDSIWECVSGQDRYIKPNRLKGVVFAVRDNLIESAKYRRGKWLNCYLVGGYPYKGERERLIELLGAREVYIDTDKDTCMERLGQCTDRDRQEWEKYITDWWLQYSGGY